MKIIDQDNNMVLLEADDEKFLDIGGAISKKVITPKDAIDLVQEISTSEAKRRQQIYTGNYENN